MAVVRASREVVIDAPPEVVMDAIADLLGWQSWSPLHKSVEVLDSHPDGRPHHVKATIKIMGFTDKQLLEYNWGPTWVVWDAEPTLQQRGQHCEYNLTPELGKTRVRFDGLIEVVAPLPEFLAKRGRKVVLDIATEGLRKRVEG